MEEGEYYDQGDGGDDTDYRSIIVTNLEPGVSELVLHEHFSDPAIGGGYVENIVFADDYSAAKITFAEREVADQVSQVQGHAIGEVVVYVEPCVPPGPGQPETPDEAYQEQEEYRDGSSRDYRDEYPEEQGHTGDYPYDDDEQRPDSHYGEPAQHEDVPYDEEQNDHGYPRETTPQSRAESMASRMRSTPGRRSFAGTPSASQPGGDAQSLRHPESTPLPTAGVSPAGTAPPSQRGTPVSAQQRPPTTPRDATPSAAAEEPGQKKTPTPSTSSILQPRTPLLQETSPPVDIHPGAISTQSQEENKSSTASLPHQSRTSLKSDEEKSRRPPAAKPVTTPQTPQSRKTTASSGKRDTDEKKPSRRSSTVRLVSTKKKPVKTDTASIKSAVPSEKPETPSAKSAVPSEKEKTPSVKTADGDQPDKEETASVKTAASDAKSVRSAFSDITVDSRPTTRTSQQIFTDVEGTLSPRYASALGETMKKPEEKLEKHAGIRFRKTIDGEIKVNGTMGQFRRAEDYVRMSLVRERPQPDKKDLDDTGSALTLSSGPTRPPTPPTPGYDNIIWQNYALRDVLHAQQTHGNTLKMDETLRDYLEHCLKDKLEEIERRHDVQIVYKGSSRVTFIDQQDTWDTQNVLNAVGSFKKLYRDTRAKIKVDVMQRPDSMSERAFVFAKHDCERKYPRVMVCKGKPGYINFYGIGEEDVRSAKNHLASKVKAHIEAAGPPSFISPSRPQSESRIEPEIERKSATPELIPSSAREDVTKTPASNGTSEVVMHTGPDHFTRTYILASKEVKVRIFKGDITEETADILVNPVNEQLQPSCDVGVTIVKAAGPVVQKEVGAYLKRYDSLKAGEVAVTSGGKLEATLVVHAVSPRWSEANTEWSSNLLSETYKNILAASHKYAAVSVAIPPLGTGILGFPYKISGDIACASLVSFLKRNPKTSIRDIRIVADDPKVAHRYSAIFNRQFSVGIPSHRGTHPAMRIELESRESHVRRSPERERGKPTTSRGDKGSLKQSGPDETSRRTSRRSAGEDEKSRTSIGSKSQGSQPTSRKSDREESSTADPKDGGGSKQSLKEGGGGTADGRPGSKKSKTESEGKPKEKSWRDQKKEGDKKDAKDNKEDSKDAKKEEEKKDDEPEESEEDKKTCRGCSKPQKDPSRLLKCEHKLCSDCMETARAELKCPVCEKTYWPPQGAQPKGTMTFEVDKKMHVAGFEKKPTIILNYNFPEGVQERGHPRPGQKFAAASFRAYLPDTSDGQKLKKLLKTAFDKGLLFGILAAESKDELCTIAWKDIIHKTGITGGPEANGYPDPDYLKRLRETLKSKGIK